MSHATMKTCQTNFIIQALFSDYCSTSTNLQKLSSSCIYCFPMHVWHACVVDFLYGSYQALCAVCCCSCAGLACFFIFSQFGVLIPFCTSSCTRVLLLQTCCDAFLVLLTASRVAYVITSSLRGFHALAHPNDVVYARLAIVIVVANLTLTGIAEVVSVQPLVGAETCKQWRKSCLLASLLPSVAVNMASVRQPVHCQERPSCTVLNGEMVPQTRTDPSHSTPKPCQVLPITDGASLWRSESFTWPLFAP